MHNVYMHVNNCIAPDEARGGSEYIDHATSVSPIPYRVDLLSLTHTYAFFVYIIITVVVLDCGRRPYVIILWHSTRVV